MVEVYTAGNFRPGRGADGCRATAVGGAFGRAYFRATPAPQWHLVASTAAAADATDDAHADTPPTPPYRASPVLTLGSTPLAFLAVSRPRAFFALSAPSLYALATPFPGALFILTIFCLPVSFSRHPHTVGGSRSLFIHRGPPS